MKQYDEVKINLFTSDSKIIVWQKQNTTYYKNNIIQSITTTTIQYNTVMKEDPQYCETVQQPILIFIDKYDKISCLRIQITIGLTINQMNFSPMGKNVYCL